MPGFAIFNEVVKQNLVVGCLTPTLADAVLLQRLFYTGFEN